MSILELLVHWSQIARFMGPTWGPPGADRNLAIRGSFIRQVFSSNDVAILQC